MLDSVLQAHIPVVNSRRSLIVTRVLAGTVFSLFLSTAALPADAQLAPSVIEPSATKAESAVVIDLKQSKVVLDEKGAEHLVDAETVKPGDVIEYRATYKNRSSKSVAGLIANLPIPEGMEYLPKSTRPGGRLPTFAAKDGRYGAEPLMRQAAGQKEISVPYNEYRAVRWQLGQLPAGGITEVSVRAKVEAVVPSVQKTVPSAQR